jgi:hypothetical protein
MRAEEGPLGAIDEGLKACEVENVCAVVVLRRAGIDDEAVDNGGSLAIEAEMRVPTICA